MATFHALGREWLVDIDGPKIRAVRAEHDGLNLTADDMSQVTALTNDHLLAADVLWTLCRKQASECGVTQEQFDAMLKGDEGDAAGRALLYAVIDFFPKHKREMLRQMLDEHLAIQRAATERAAQRLLNPTTLEAMKAAALDNVDAAIDQALANLTQRSNATDSPESAE